MPTEPQGRRLPSLCRTIRRELVLRDALQTTSQASLSGITGRSADTFVQSYGKQDWSGLHALWSRGVYISRNSGS